MVQQIRVSFLLHGSLCGTLLTQKSSPHLLHCYEYTPCQFSKMEEVIEAIAITHAEFILVHPFREGNGRIGRLLTTLMALRAGLPILDFDCLKGEKERQAYFMAIQASMARNYQPLKTIFTEVLQQTLNL